MKLRQICSSVFLIVGLCASGYADEHFPFLAQVSKKSVNIRAGANTNFEKIDQLSEGAEVIVLAKSFDWYKVQLPLTAKAYVRADYLKIKQNSMAELIGDKVNIRAAANSESASLGMIKKGEAVKVIAQVNDWWQIEPPVQAAGWIRQDFLSVKSATVDATTLTNAKAPMPANTTALKLIEVKGMLKAIAGSDSQARYQLVADDQMVYYIQSIPDLDCFKGAKVSVKGFIVADPDHTHAHPILHAAHVSLLL